MKDAMNENKLLHLWYRKKRKKKKGRKTTDTNRHYYATKCIETIVITDGRRSPKV